MGTRMSAHLVVLILALLLGLQAVTTDLYLPALPAIRDVFGASMGEIQLTLTVLLLAFGVSQLVWGPLSDRFGRRPVLVGGMAAYVAASLACTFAPAMGWLIAARGVQGVAMGAAVMAARAVVRDLYAPTQGATVMSKALTGLGIIACTCAPVGGLLTDTVGWRYTLLAVTLFGLLTLAMLVWRFEETLARPNPQALQWQSLWRANLEIIRHPTFRAWCALSAGSYLGLFTFLASSSFVFTRSLGYSKTAYGLFMLTMSLSYIVGTFWCRWMLRRTSVHRTVAVAAVPAGQDAVHDNVETTHSTWLHPRQALEDYWEHRIELAPPQIMSLVQLLRHDSVQSVLEESRQRPPVTIQPEPFDDNGVRTICYPGDTRHSQTERAMHGPTRLRFVDRRFEPVGGFEAFFA